MAVDTTNPDLPAEQWRVIEFAPDYEVSSLGRVRRCAPDWQGKYMGRILRPSFCRKYARHHLAHNGKITTYGVHILVCTAFNGPRPDPSYHCAHRDDDQSNNTPENLYWATPKQNMADAIRNKRVRRGPRPQHEIERLSRGDDHWTRKNPERVLKGKAHWRTGTTGLGAKGEAMGMAKLSESDVLQILATPKKHGSGRALAERYGVSMGLISAIRKRRVWKYLSHTSPSPVGGNVTQT